MRGIIISRLFKVCFCCFNLMFDCLAVSIVSSDDSPIVTNKNDSIAYCAVMFASETNKIPIAAATKVLEAYDKILEAKSAELASIYVRMSDMYTIEQFLNHRCIDSKELIMLQAWLENVFKSNSYGSLRALDSVLCFELMNAQLVSRLSYDTEYENMQNKLTDKQFSAFVVIRAYYRAKMNEALIKVIKKKRFREEVSEGSDTKEVGGDISGSIVSQLGKEQATNSVENVKSPKVSK